MLQEYQRSKRGRIYCLRASGHCPAALVAESTTAEQVGSMCFAQAVDIPEPALLSDYSVQAFDIQAARAAPLPEREAQVSDMQAAPALNIESPEEGKPSDKGAVDSADKTADKAAPFVAGKAVDAAAELVVLPVLVVVWGRLDSRQFEVQDCPVA